MFALLCSALPCPAFSDASGDQRWLSLYTWPGPRVKALYPVDRSQAGQRWPASSSLHLADTVYSRVYRCAALVIFPLEQHTYITPTAACLCQLRSTVCTVGLAQTLPTYASSKHDVVAATPPARELHAQRTAASGGSTVVGRARCMHQKAERKLDGKQFVDALKHRPLLSRYLYLRRSVPLSWSVVALY